MRDDLEKRLEERFSFMRRRIGYEEQKAQRRITDLYGAYGCDVGDGWFALIWNMCEEIEELYAKAGRRCDMIPVQVKEKFAALRFYFDFEGQVQTIHAIDFLRKGTLRCTHEDSQIHKDVDRIVAKYEEMSASVCECCGNAGEIRRDLPWIKTLCQMCYEKRVNRKSDNKQKEDR